ncbi:MAG: Y-family DNA polymerase, partial [Ancrocorticia sp.]
MRISGSVWVPDWAVTAVEISGEIEPGTPAAVYGKSGIVSANSWARTEGVREGMSRRGAHALCPSAVLLPADPMREAARFEPIMRALDRHIANALVIEPGRVLFTATGAIRAAGGPEPLAEAVIGEINDAAGCEGLVGFGQGTLTALLAASGNECVVPERTISYLDNKPLSALRVAASSQRVLLEITECIELLGRLGISRIGGLRKLGRIALMTRFGQTGHLIWRLISAEDVHVAGQQKAAPEFSASRGFDPPLDNTEQTVFAAKMLADELGEEMASRSLAGGRLAINAHLMSGSELRRSWLLDGGGVKDIVDRVRWQLASWLSGGEEGS